MRFTYIHSYTLHLIFPIRDAYNAFKKVAEKISAIDAAVEEMENNEENSDDDDDDDDEEDDEVVVNDDDKE